MSDHVRMLVSIPPKYSVSGHRRKFTGQSFWARGYFVSTVGKDENAVREYVRQPEAEDRRLDQLNL